MPTKMAQYHNFYFSVKLIVIQKDNSDNSESGNCEVKVSHLRV